MYFFIVVISVAILQIWGAENPLHRDGWFTRWSQAVTEKFTTLHNSIRLIFILGGPIFALMLIQSILVGMGSWLILPFGIVILLYSLGRGEFSDIVGEYTKACYKEDWSDAIERAGRLGVNTEDLPEDDWNQLHERVLVEAGYRGFERMFAVLFWFALLGPIGAFWYRILFLQVIDAEQSAHAGDSLDSGGSAASRLLWLMEWPAVRLLGLSFALTGNFVGCFHRWKESLFCVERSTGSVLSLSILGALSVSDDIDQTCEVTRKELSLLHRLYTRTLWLWLAASALFVLL